jgi:hypothetical protein
MAISRIEAPHPTAPKTTYNTFIYDNTMGCHLAAVCVVVLPPLTAAIPGDCTASASLVDFRGRRTVVFLLCTLMSKIWAFRYFWP